MKILHIEDDMNSARLVEMYVTSTHHEIVTVYNVHEAISVMESDRPDLILLDLVLNGQRDGFSLVRDLRQQGFDLPIIAVTALSTRQDLRECNDVGIDHVLVKPFTIKQLAQVIQTYNVTA
ncbi:MAG: response regulator [Anaerolineae bacterium]